MPNPLAAITNYLRSSIVELKKVTWPSREQTQRYAVLVIVVSVAVATFFASLDLGLSKLVTVSLSRRPVETPPVTLPDVSLEEIETATTGADSGTVKITPAPEPPKPEAGFELPPIETKANP